MKHSVIHNGKVVLEVGKGMYDFATAFAQGYAKCLGIADSFVNPSSPLILDKWVKGGEMVIVTKNK